MFLNQRLITKMSKGAVLHYKSYSDGAVYNSNPTFSAWLTVEYVGDLVVITVNSKSLGVILDINWSQLYGEPVEFTVSENKFVLTYTQTEGIRKIWQATLSFPGTPNTMDLTIHVYGRELIEETWKMDNSFDSLYDEYTFMPLEEDLMSSVCVPQPSAWSRPISRADLPTDLADTVLAVYFDGFSSVNFFTYDTLVSYGWNGLTIHSLFQVIQTSVVDWSTPVEIELLSNDSARLRFSAPAEKYSEDVINTSIFPESSSERPTYIEYSPESYEGFFSKLLVAEINALPLPENLTFHFRTPVTGVPEEDVSSRKLTVATGSYSSAVALLSAVFSRDVLEWDTYYNGQNTGDNNHYRPAGFSILTDNGVDIVQLSIPYTGNYNDFHEYRLLKTGDSESDQWFAAVFRGSELSVDDPNIVYTSQIRLITKELPALYVQDFFDSPPFVVQCGSNPD